MNTLFRVRIRWPVLKCPPMAGFKMSTEGGRREDGARDSAQLYQRHCRLSALGRGDIHPGQQPHADVWTEWQPFVENLFGVLAHLQAQEGVNFEIRPRRG